MQISYKYIKCKHCPCFIYSPFPFFLSHLIISFLTLKSNNLYISEIKLLKHLPIKHITTAASKRIYSKVAGTDKGNRH